jgi:hypothetical protein
LGEAIAIEKRDPSLCYFKSFAPERLFMLVLSETLDQQFTGRGYLVFAAVISLLFQFPVIRV